MFTVSLILVFSVALFLYWFRYCCLLILQTRSSLLASGNLAALGLAVAEVRSRLSEREHDTPALDSLSAQLQRDFTTVSLMLSRSVAQIDPIERRMLVLDYWLMRVLYQLTRRFARPQAQAALKEISDIVGYFAYSAVPRLSHQATA